MPAVKRRSVITHGWKADFVSILNAGWVFVLRWLVPEPDLARLLEDEVRRQRSIKLIERAKQIGYPRSKRRIVRVSGRIGTSGYAGDAEVFLLVIPDHSLVGADHDLPLAVTVPIDEVTSIGV